MISIVSCSKHLVLFFQLMQSRWAFKFEEWRYRMISLLSKCIGSVGFPVGLVVPWPANSSHTKYPVTVCIGQLDGI